MDIRTIVIQDRELLEEFADALSDRAPDIERDVARLKKTPHDPPDNSNSPKQNAPQSAR